MKRVAVLDPGRCKCGLVLADLDLGLVREGHLLTPEAVEPWLERWNQDQPLDHILIGNGTGSQACLASCAIADQDVVQRLVLIPSLQPGFHGLWGEEVALADKSKIKIGQHQATLAAAWIEHCNTLHREASILTTTGSALSLTPEAITFKITLWLGSSIRLWAS